MHKVIEMTIEIEAPCNDICAERITDFLHLLGAKRSSKPLRIRMLLLCQKPQQSSRVASELGITADLASKQLQNLLTHELVTVTADGAKRIYQTAPHIVPLIDFGIKIYK